MYHLNEPERDGVIVPALRFFQGFESFKSYIRINCLMKSLSMTDEAKDLLWMVQSQDTLDDVVVIDMTIEEIAEKLRELRFKRPLKDYQLENVQHHLRRTSAADYSVPGSGKSTTALALFTIRKSLLPNLVMFIVVPKNVFRSWEEQNEDCFEFPLITFRLNGGAERIQASLYGKYDVFLITYEALNNASQVVADYFRNHEVALYLDECHRMKGGVNTLTGQTVLNLAHLPAYKTIISGTPMPNKESDIVSQFQFLFPSIRTDETTVKEQIQSVYTRTTNRDMNLQSYTLKRTRIKMDKPLRGAYQLLLGMELDRILEDSVNYFEMLRRIKRYSVKLIQLASNPSLLLRTQPELILIPEFEAITKRLSPKIMASVSNTFKLASEGKKVLIWSNFIETIQTLETQLRSLNPVTIYGATPIGSEEDDFTREGKIYKFRNDDSCLVMIANPMAASEGISLHTVCHNQIFVDRNYDARLFEQAINRTYRVGLPKDKEVEVEILMLENSIDEIIDARLGIKLDRMYRVLNDERLLVETDHDQPTIEDADYQTSNGMSDEDARELILAIRSHLPITGEV
ncbi:DEAD/DEAH box helicase [Sporosarcina sp. E16_8]|uniref:SNF2-related protein n=1 Tax=Sporosarcina sp. E16_8 TaxID=2789295 RepID=UPI0021044C46|nr:DEAD/DEAH box helicase [Sporosarcina sp. E16_8]